MDSSIFDKAVSKSVWMTEAGYPAIVNEVSNSEIIGVVISPSGTVSCAWDMSGENKSGHPKFFNLKYSPDSIQHKYAVIKGGSLIGSTTDSDSANEMGVQNSADLVCKYLDLVKVTLGEH